MRFFTCVIALLVAAWTSVGSAATAEDATPVLRIETARHSARINSAAIDVAGHTLITVSDDKTARIWSLPALRPLGVLRPAIGPGPEGKLYAVAVSPDGALVAVGGFRAEVLLFDMRTREIARRWGGLADSVLSLAFSCDGSRLAVGLGSGMRILRVSDGSVLTEDHDYSGGAYGLSFACSGLLAASSLDGAVRLYDGTGNKIAQITTQAGHRPTHLRFSPDGSLLAIGFNDAVAVEVRDGKTLEPRYRPSVAGLTGRSLDVVSWSTSGRLLYAGGATAGGSGSPVFAWDAAGRGARRIVEAGFPTIAAIEPLGDDVIAVASIEGDVAVTTGDGRRVANIMPLKADFSVGGKPSHPSRRFRLSPDGTTVEWVPLATEARYDLFDAEHLFWDEATQQQPQLFLADWEADAGSLHATDWDGGKQPRLNGTPLTLEPNERVDSVALRNGHVLIGTEWLLRMFDDVGHPVWKTRLPAPAWRVNQSPDGRLAVAALADGTLRWYRLSDGHELLAAFLTREGGRWIAFTPSGYYAAAPGAEDLIGWHVNQAPDQVALFYPASRFRDVFYRPDVVRLVLSSLDEAAALRQADTARGALAPKAAPITQDLPPVLTILSPADGTHISEGNIEIEYSVRSPSGRPLRDVKVLIDGLPVPATRAGDEEAIPQPATRDGEAHAKVHVNVPPGRSVTVALLADTDSRTSEPAKVVLVGPAQPASAVRVDVLKPRLNAILIGVSAYTHEDLRHGVEFAADDAIAIKAELEQQRARGLYREVNTKLLVDHDATREAVIDALDWLSQQTTTNDISVVYLAGHGVNEDGHVSFLPVGGDTDRVTATGLSQADMLGLLGRVVGRKVAFLDFCHSGGAVLAQNTRGTDDVDIVGLLNQLREPGSGLIVFAAATAREPAIQLADLRHGAFTVALLEAFDGQADLLRNGSVNTGELNVFLSDRLRVLTHGKQHPIMEKADDVPDFPLVVTR